MLRVVDAWQEWDAREKRVQEAKWGDQGSDKEEEEDDDGLPFACYICRCSAASSHSPQYLLHASFRIAARNWLIRCWPLPCAAGSHGRRWRTR